MHLERNTTPGEATLRKSDSDVELAINGIIAVGRPRPHVISLDSFSCDESIFADLFLLPYNSFRQLIRVLHMED
jgi:hypothetical protein